MKNFNLNQLITSGDMSGHITGSVYAIQYEDNVGMQAVWSGTPTGSLTVQASLTYEERGNGLVHASGTWTTVQDDVGSPMSLALSGSGDALFDLNQLPFPFVRVVYTRTGGSGTLDLHASKKSV